jgi:hypothetical protein
MWTSCWSPSRSGERPRPSSAVWEFDELVAANLLEAELRAAFAREG